MGAWLFALLSISITVVIITGAPLENNNRPCLAWDCRREMFLRKRILNALRAAESVNKKSSVIEAEQEPCIAFDCKRKRRAVVAMTTDATQEVGDDAPCLTRDCRTGKRSDQGSSLMEKLRFDAILEETADDAPCLTRDCRAGKRSNEEPSLLKKFRFSRAIPEPQSNPACLAWWCTGPPGPGGK